MALEQTTFLQQSAIPVSTVLGSEIGCTLHIHAGRAFSSDPPSCLVWWGYTSPVPAWHLETTPAHSSPRRPCQHAAETLNKLTEEIPVQYTALAPWITSCLMSGGYSSSKVSTLTGFFADLMEYNPESGQLL